MFETLPTLGLGVSLSLAAQPDPLALALQDQGPSFIEYSGLLDVQRVLTDVQRIKDANIPLLFHPSYINFCGSSQNNQDWLKTTAEHVKTVGSAWFAQDCAYCFWGDNHGYSSQFGYFIPPIFNQASLELAVERITEVQNCVGIPVAIEPPPVTFVVGDMPLFEFIGKLAETTDCAILLDMGHLVSFEMATFSQVMDELEHLPLERVVEIHIAGGKIKQGELGPVYIDAHESDILTQTWQMLDALLPQLPNVKALCYECEGVDEAKVLSTLAILREKILSLSVSKDLVHNVQAVSVVSS